MVQTARKCRVGACEPVALRQTDTTTAFLPGRGSIVCETNRHLEFPNTVTV